jgi:hypothetical protein
MLRGNGGSSPDCQHVATEFVGRPCADLDRTALSACALTIIGSFHTAFLNDWQFDGIFARIAKEQASLALTMSLRRIGRPLLRSESFTNLPSAALTAGAVALGASGSKVHNNHNGRFVHDPSAQEIERGG